MKVTFSCPSKTFLVGEYAALLGAPALILNNKPRFELILEKTEQTEIDIFHEGSPAARWLKERRPLLEGYTLKFIDPHQGRGGFGASSAQFLLSHCATTFLQISAERAREGFDLQAVWNDYQVLSENSSGYDVLSQALGGVAHVETSTWVLQALPWKFSDLDFVIARTGNKIETHTHLTDLERKHFEGLAEVSSEVCRAFEDGERHEFLNNLRRYGDELKARDLVAPWTDSFIRLASTEPAIEVARGCGALGADTVLLLFEPSGRMKVESFLRKQDLEILADTTSLNEGLEWTDGE